MAGSVSYYDLRSVVLTDEEKNALATLQKCGWILGCDCMLRDMTLDGERLPTFKYEGRKPIVIVLPATEWTERRLKQRDAESQAAEAEEQPKKRGRPPKSEK